MADSDPDWLGELRWQGYPRMAPQRDVSTLPQDAPAAPNKLGTLAANARLLELEQENAALRSRLEEMIKLSAQFERHLSEAGTAHEVAVMQAQSRQRDAALDRERLSGELQASKAEAANLIARDTAREADLRLERERRADSEKALHDARRRLLELTEETERLRASASEQAGALAEFRRQASAQNERLLHSKALTDQDIQLLRQELREFLAQFHRIQDTAGEKP